MKVLKPHLFIKRFANDDPSLTKACKEQRLKNNFDAKVDYGGKGRSQCHVCRRNVDKNYVRMALVLQCHRGWKYPAYLHFECFWKHPEARKLDMVDEIHGLIDMKQSDQEMIRKQFTEFKLSDTKNMVNSASKLKKQGNDENFEKIGKTSSVKTENDETNEKVDKTSSVKAERKKNNEKVNQVQNTNTTKRTQQSKDTMHPKRVKTE